MPLILRTTGDLVQSDVLAEQRNVVIVVLLIRAGHPGRPQTLVIVEAELLDTKFGMSRICLDLAFLVSVPDELVQCVSFFPAIARVSKPLSQQLIGLTEPSLQAGQRMLTTG